MESSTPEIDVSKLLDMAKDIKDINSQLESLKRTENLLRGLRASLSEEIVIERNNISKEIMEEVDEEVSSLIEKVEV